MKLPGSFAPVEKDAFETIAAKVPHLSAEEFRALQTKLRTVSDVFYAAANRQENSADVVEGIGRGLGLIAELAKSFA